MANQQSIDVVFLNTIPRKDGENMCSPSRLILIKQVYFYGELVPPYIDKLGRGALLRSTDLENTLYQSEAKCYRNLQALGSKVSMA